MITPELHTIIAAARQRELIDAEAWSAALNAGTRADCLSLIAPYMAQHLRASDDGTVHVVDARGNVRHGVTPEMMANEVRARYDTQHPGRYFTQER